MTAMPADARGRLEQLSRRLAAGVFLDAWIPSAIAALMVAGSAALVCRIFVPAAAGAVRWLWIAPVLAVVPAAVVCWRRAFSPADVVAIADWLAGGDGMLMAVAETGDGAWLGSAPLARASAFQLPRLRPWRKLPWLVASAAFLAVALSVPQRTPRASNTAVAQEIANRLKTTVLELKQQKLVTPDEEKALEDAIERVRRGAEQRVDASSWEAADALRDKLAADVADKQNALKWAEASLARYAAAQAGGKGARGAPAKAAELTEALEKLARSGLLADAPESLKQLLKSRLPTDPAALRQLTATMAKYLADAKGRVGNVASLGKEVGRFNPADFPVGQDGLDGNGEPASGGITRGRADAELTWGKETAPFDKFKARALPPGAARSADDWAPVVELPGAPQAAPQLSSSSNARDYAAAAGQAAWRRGLAPRHQSAVKKYFAR